MSLVIGLVGGWVTVVTGGIGAILLAHAVTRFAIFVATGHAGQVTPSAAFDEEVVEEDSKVTPAGLGSRRREPGPLTCTACRSAAPVALYIHFPFCLSVCPYCDFVVYGGRAARGPENRIDGPRRRTRH